jgi:RsiW-degrading membrane proteinase PrsW (M82 family)
MALPLSIFFGFVPMFIFAWFVYWLDRYEKEPALLLGGVFIWGAVVASGAAFLINTVLGLGIYLATGSQGAAEFSTGSFIAPIVEESLKGFTVLLVFLVFRHEFDSVLDGMIYAAIAALGFAATENAYYIYTLGFQQNGYAGLFGMVFIRVILVGWQHPFYTTFTGIGLAIARLNRNILLKLTAPILGWFGAVFTHSFHNTIASIISGPSALVVGAFFDWSGWMIMFIFALWMLRRDKQLMVKYLRDEVALGSITTEQYRVACSAAAQGKARFSALNSGHYQATNRFYQLCGELAHKKNELINLGDEGRNTALVARMREEMKILSPTVM